MSRDPDDFEGLRHPHCLLPLQPLAALKPLLLPFVIALSCASAATAQTVYLFEGTAATATTRSFLPCGDFACDWPFPHEPGDLIKSDLVTVYSNVEFQVAFVLPELSGPGFPPGHFDSAWEDNAWFISSDTATETETLTYNGDPSDTVTETILPNATAGGAMFGPDDGSGPTYWQYGAGAATFGYGGFTCRSRSGTPWVWVYPGVMPHPNAVGFSEAVAPGYSGNFSYTDRETCTNELTTELSLTGITNLVVSRYSGDALPSLPAAAPSPVPAAGPVGAAALAAMLGASSLVWMSVRGVARRRRSAH